MKILLVVDAQNDFVTGALANLEAQKVVPKLYDKIKSCINDGWVVLFTQDTHWAETYEQSMEGKHLPVPHCIDESEGWRIIPELKEFWESNWRLTKHRFGDINLYQRIEKHVPEKLLEKEPIEEIQLVGFCTDICVVSNALILKASVYGENTIISCDASCCAGTSIEAHAAALTVMQSCQVEVKNAVE